jgi:hypothetical protein
MTPRERAFAVIRDCGELDNVPVAALAEDLLERIERAGLLVVGTCGTCVQWSAPSEFCYANNREMHEDDGCSRWASTG